MFTSLPKASKTVYTQPYYVKPEPEPEEPAAGRWFFPPDLPRLEKDSFGWTQAELDEAVRTARRWRETGAVE